jgi:hypothetical protein
MTASINLLNTRDNLLARITAVAGLAAKYPFLHDMSEKELRLVLRRYDLHGLGAGAYFTDVLIPEYSDDDWNFEREDFSPQFIDWYVENQAEGDWEAARAMLCEEDVWPSSAPVEMMELDVFGFLSRNGELVPTVIMGRVDQAAISRYSNGLLGYTDENAQVQERWNWCVENCRGDWWTTCDEQGNYDKSYVLCVAFTDQYDARAYRAAFADK